MNQPLPNQRAINTDREVFDSDSPSYDPEAILEAADRWRDEQKDRMLEKALEEDES